MSVRGSRWATMIALAVVALTVASCTSLSPEQVVVNQQTRLEQQHRGYFDREDSAQQKKAEDRAAQEQQHRKN